MKPTVEAGEAAAAAAVDAGTDAGTVVEWRASEARCLGNLADAQGIQCTEAVSDPFASAAAWLDTRYTGAGAALGRSRFAERQKGFVEEAAAAAVAVAAAGPSQH